MPFFFAARPCFEFFKRAPVGLEHKAKGQDALVKMPTKTTCFGVVRHIARELDKVPSDRKPFVCQEQVVHMPADNEEDEGFLSVGSEFFAQNFTHSNLVNPR